LSTPYRAESAPASPPAISRRRFVVTGAMAACAVALPSAELHATRRVQLSEHLVAVPGLPAVLGGISIAHVTDLHFYDAEIHPAAENALEVIAGARPDVVVLTGDQWETRAGQAGLLAWLERLPGEAQVLACLGNHEYSADVSGPAAERLHARGGCDLLRNRTVTLRVRGADLQVVGLDDWRYGRQDPSAVSQRLDPELPQLWLVHEPEHVDRYDWPDAARPTLVLAGHTHGGQIRLPGIAPLTPRGSGRYVNGSYRTPKGPLYVSRGVGTSGVRLRVGCPPEVPIFTLRSA
jgi:predicted MPP superfamily phosphohydrolase